MIKYYDEFLKDLRANDPEFEKEIRIIELKYLVIDALLTYRKKHKMS
jgi:hypothetical protein